MRIANLLLPLVIALPAEAFAWNATGHSVVAELAARQLDAEAAETVKRLVGGDSLASLSTWADDYKFTPSGKITKPWHYANIDIAKTGAADTIDEAGWAAAVAEVCKTAELVDCLPNALRTQIGILADAATPDETRRDALLMVVHLTGDISQPHHCASRKAAGSDKLDGGGNDVDAVFIRERDDTKLTYEAGLHLVWDEQLLDAYDYGWTSLVSQIQLVDVPADVADLSGDYVDRWLRECHQLAKKSYAALPVAVNGVVPIGPAYQEAVKADTLALMSRAGSRLAAVLNTSLGGK